MEWRNQILQGDALSMLAALPDNSVQCCVTSPPYFQLRSYLPDNHALKACEIGAEQTPQEYVEKMVGILRIVRQKLRPDGTLWLNIGDTFAGSGRGNGGKHAYVEGMGRRQPLPMGIKAKDLIGIPWLLAFALRQDGWYLRSEIIWHKKNAIPESVTDRPTKCHETVFLLTKSPRYYYDGAAIAEPSVSRHPSGNGYKRASRLSFQNTDGTPRGSDQQWTPKDTRQRRSVWSVNTKKYPAAHFAVMPEKLVEPCILASTSTKACEICGACWKREHIRTGHQNKREEAHVPNNVTTKTDSTGWKPVSIATDVWMPGCTCSGNTGQGRAVVLDPFAGAGTVPYVAMQHGRDYVGIELFEEYIDIIHERLGIVQQHLWTAGVA